MNGKWSAAKSWRLLRSHTVCCIRTPGAAPTQPAVGEAAHVLFEIAGTRRLSLPDLASPYAGAVYLGHRILENPTDLRSHVQRILLLIDKGDESDLQGALVDLFIALGDKGGALKRRLLNLSGRRMSRMVTTFLRKRLAIGIRPWEASASRLRNSLLSLGFSGVHEVVHRRDRGSPSVHGNALAEARACLESGQVNAAREMLERALLLAPANDAVAAELLEIYRSTGDGERRASMRQFLLTALPDLPASWRGDSSANAGLPQSFATTYCGLLPPMDQGSRS